MAPHVFGKPKKASHIFTHPDVPPRAFLYPEDPLVDFTRLGEPLVDSMRLEEPRCAVLREVARRDKDGELRPLMAAPFPKPDGPDNTVGPVPKTSGYVFNTLQRNFAAHVPNTKMNTHLCSEFIRNNIPKLVSHSMTPDTNDYGVAPPNCQKR